MHFEKQVRFELMSAHHNGISEGWQEALDAAHALIDIHSHQYQTEQEKNVCAQISGMIEELMEPRFKMGGKLQF